MARGGPGGFDVNALMKQAQQMQQQMLEAQEQLKDEVVEASAGGGMVKVKMGGDLTLREIAIDPEAIDPEEAEMLADMVQAAVNEALRAAQDLAGSKMGGITGGHGRHGRPPRDVSAEGPAPLSRLVAELSRLPGIGQRTAQRLAFHILRAPDEEAAALAAAIREVKEKVGLCERCFNLSEGPLCRICTDSSRDQATICVVEEPADVIPIERTHEYRGLYHVLGGALSPIDGVDADDLKIAELLRRVAGGGRTRGGSRHQPDHHRRGDRPPHRRAAARPGHRHPPRQRPADRRRPRARRRGHPRQRLRRPPHPRLSRSQRCIDVLAISPRRVSSRKLRIFGALASARIAKVSAWRRTLRHGPARGGLAGRAARPRGVVLAGLAAGQAARGDGRRRRRAVRRRGAEAGRGVRLGHRDRGRHALGARRDCRRRRRRTSIRASTGPARCAAGSTSCSSATAATSSPSRWSSSTSRDPGRATTTPVAAGRRRLPSSVRRSRERPPRRRDLPARGGRALRARSRPGHGRRRADGRAAAAASSTTSSGRAACGSAISAGVVACPEHGNDAERLLHKADEAMWRARAVSQPVGVGALERPLQDR